MLKKNEKIFKASTRSLQNLMNWHFHYIRSPIHKSTRKYPRLSLTSCTLHESKIIIFKRNYRYCLIIFFGIQQSTDLTIEMYQDMYPIRYTHNYTKYSSTFMIYLCDYQNPKGPYISSPIQKSTTLQIVQLLRYVLKIALYMITHPRIDPANVTY